MQIRATIRKPMGQSHIKRELRHSLISPTRDHLVQVVSKKPTAGHLFEWFSTEQTAAPSRFTDIFGILTHNINWLPVCCIMYMSDTLLTFMYYINLTLGSNIVKQLEMAMLATIL